jgi:hypothetical protein
VSRVEHQRLVAFLIGPLGDVDVWSRRRAGGLPLLQVALMACAGGPTPFFHSLLIARLGETCVLEETSVGAYGILRSSRRGSGHGISTTLGARSRRMRSRRARIPGGSPRCPGTRRSRCSSPGTTVTSRSWSARRCTFLRPARPKRHVAGLTRCSPWTVQLAMRRCRWWVCVSKTRTQPSNVVRARRHLVGRAPSSLHGETIPRVRLELNGHRHRRRSSNKRARARIRPPGDVTRS